LILTYISDSTLYADETPRHHDQPPGGIRDDLPAFMLLVGMRLFLRLSLVFLRGERARGGVDSEGEGGRE
jgi:hypothetical protein